MSLVEQKFILPHLDGICCGPQIIRPSEVLALLHLIQSLQADFYQQRQVLLSNDANRENALSVEYILLELNEFLREFHLYDTPFSNLEFLTEELGDIIFLIMARIIGSKIEIDHRQITQRLEHHPSQSTMHTDQLMDILNDWSVAKKDRDLSKIINELLFRLFVDAATIPMEPLIQAYMKVMAKNKSRFLIDGKQGLPGFSEPEGDNKQAESQYTLGRTLMGILRGVTGNGHSGTHHLVVLPFLPLFRQLSHHDEMANLMRQVLEEYKDVFGMFASLVAMKNSLVFENEHLSGLHSNDSAYDAKRNIFMMHQAEYKKREQEVLNSFKNILPRIKSRVSQLLQGMIGLKSADARILVASKYSKDV